MKPYLNIVVLLVFWYTTTFLASVRYQTTRDEARQPSVNMVIFLTNKITQIGYIVYSDAS
jgi:hypothetical protein